MRWNRISSQASIFKSRNKLQKHALTLFIGKHTIRKHRNHAQHHSRRSTSWCRICSVNVWFISMRASWWCEHWTDTTRVWFTWSLMPTIFVFVFRCFWFIEGAACSQRQTKIVALKNQLYTKRNLLVDKHFSIVFISLIFWTLYNNLWENDF